MMSKIKTRPKKPTPRVLSLQQQNLLFNTLRQTGNLRDSTLIFLVLKTGLKSAEVCKLNAADVFRDGQVIATLTVRPEIATNGISRRLPLSRDVQNAIEAFIRWKRQAGESLQPSAPLFCTARTQKRLIPRDFQRLLKNACTALGYQFTPSDLRHTFATELYQKTGDLESVRVALGLRSLKPEQVAMYTHLSESGQPQVSLAHSEQESDAEILPPKKGVWQTYDATNGLPGAATCLLQDRCGYLWVGTTVGLCRYDGAEFITYTIADGLASDTVQAICGDRNGHLWIGTGFLHSPGKGVSMFDGERFVTYTTADGLAHNHVLDIFCDSHGRLWFATLGGVSMFDGEGFVSYMPPADEAGRNHVSVICEDRQGRLWFGTHEMAITRNPGRGVIGYDGERFFTLTTDDGLAHDDVCTVYADSNGRLWFGAAVSGGGGLSVYDEGRFTNYSPDDGLVAAGVSAIHEDRAARMWIGGFYGVTCIDHPDLSPPLSNSETVEEMPPPPVGTRFTTYTIDDGLAANANWDITDDREGGVWFAHNGRLTRFDPETLGVLTKEPVNDTLSQDRAGKLWFSYHRKLCCLHDGQQRHRTFFSTVNSVLEDSRGFFWVTVNAEGVRRYHSPDAVWTGEGDLFCRENGLDGDFPGAILESSDGTIWVGTTLESGEDNGLHRFDGERFVAMSASHVPIFLLFEDSRKRIWMGGRWGGGLSCYNGERLRTYTTRDGLPDDKIQSILEDDGGNLWVGTQRGLCRFDGRRFIVYGQEQGLTSQYHCCSAKDAHEHLWFGTLLGGLYRYDGQHFQHLTTDDGLPSNHISGLIPQPDGSMIIGTFRGIVHYRPTATVPPRIEIREVVADQVYQIPTSLGLTAGSSQGLPLLTISYHGLSFATRRMRYSYILEGYDKAWRDTWETSVRYENLPPGEYTFKVIAINRDFVESEAPATLKLTVRPDPRDLEIATLRTEVHHLRREVSGRYDFSNLIGRSAAIKQVHLLMERAIDSGLNVLITGETGTGKELVANGIHYNSPRGTQTPVTCDCGTLSKDLAASELFGHPKGAFTDAHADKIGLFEAANGNTLILDEIGNMPLEVQRNLLRALDEGKIRRVGESIPRNVDVRVIAMTNLDLEKETEAGRFREDLYYRLNEFPLPLPPLRERREDIPLLAEYFLREIDKDIDGFAPGVFEMLQSYNWPGNVRELQKAIRLAAAFAEQGQRLETHHFAWQISQGESLIQEVMAAVGQKPWLTKTTNYRELVNQFERRCIEHALAACNGNRTQAAKMLGLHRTQLIRRMKDLNIE